MALDPQLWQELEGHGVTAAHLEMLLSLLRAQRNGSYCWHVHEGHLTTCDLRLTFPARPRELERITALELVAKKMA